MPRLFSLLKDLVLKGGIKNTAECYEKRVFQKKYTSGGIRMSGQLDPKTKELVAIGASIAANCQP